MLFEEALRKTGQVFFSYKDGYKDLLRYKKDFTQFSELDKEQIESYSLQKLKSLLEHATNTSAYYKSLKSELNLELHPITNREELSHLPLLTKDIIDSRAEEIISSMYDEKDLELSFTGGTSGRQCSFYRDITCSSIRRGRQLGILEKCGYHMGMRRGLIWGAHEDLSLESNQWDLKKSLRKFVSGDEVLCCTTMTDEKLMDYYHRLTAFSPQVLYGYPNAITHFAHFIDDSGLEPINVDKIFCTAEKLKTRQRRILTEAFNAEVFDMYCTREHGCIGFECSMHDGYHIDVGSVIIEITDDKGTPLPFGATGDLVITDLLNYGMPFIRNKIGDRGALKTGPCKCGCSLPMLQSLDGRINDMFNLPDGSSVSGLMLSDMFIDNQAIKKFQIVQKTIDKFVLNIAVGDNYDSEVEMAILNETKGFLGQDVTIQIDLYPDISNSPLSGKFQEVINELGNNR